jgi:hypothetical protein
MVTATLFPSEFVKQHHRGVVLTIAALELAVAVSYVDWQLKQRKAAAVRVGALLTTAARWLHTPPRAEELKSIRDKDGYDWPSAVANEFATVEALVEADVRWPEIITLGAMLAASVLFALVVCYCL